ncbi:hypothetical protein IscW_ISCW017378 [Ixodes scapularis]|uniref:Uncharacterized protein n=1 Tax=Ixodes scapularis TaxID=6945 RepID=B7PD51_IXOSC|nr:hypothetical protein IscW_ISCW017378 [Ixodes scapularis]|eukprot:XP_002410613.1 hypothetical protein IscW_ISCW017378 [Ixodes scapularis]
MDPTAALLTTETIQKTVSRDGLEAVMESFPEPKPSRLVTLLESASECAYSLFFCGYRSLFVDSYQFEDFVFYSLWDALPALLCDRTRCPT